MGTYPPTALIVPHHQWISPSDEQVLQALALRRGSAGSSRIHGIGGGTNGYPGDTSDGGLSITGSRHRSSNMSERGQADNNPVLSLSVSYRHYLALDEGEEKVMVRSPQLPILPTS